MCSAMLVIVVLAQSQPNVRYEKRSGLLQLGCSVFRLVLAASQHTHESHQRIDFELNIQGEERHLVWALPFQ